MLWIDKKEVFEHDEFKLHSSFKKSVECKVTHHSILE